MLGISNDRQFRRLAEALGCAHWLSDLRYASNVSRVANRITLNPALDQIFGQRERLHWIELLERFDIPVSPIQSPQELLIDPQLQALGQMHTIDLGEGSVDVPKLPFELSETPTEPSSNVPKLGEHGWEILSEAGFSAAEIQNLLDQGVCWLANS